MTVENSIQSRSLESLTRRLSLLLSQAEITEDSVRQMADELQAEFSGQVLPEAVRMLLAIAAGALMGPRDGWFGPAVARYDWRWLTERVGATGSSGIRADQFIGRGDWFRWLDRNRDGVITAEDLDWAESNHWVQHAYVVNRLLRRLDTKGDGHLLQDEWQAFFESVAQGRTAVRIDELREAWISGISASFYPGDAPTQVQLLRGLLTGELGSLYEGPQLNDAAPDFTLKTVEGESIRLADRIGQRPIVLMFGNFTCSPFRSMYPAVNEISQRFQDDATFLGVYVREAHPTDGWKMESNLRVGVCVAQPGSYTERAVVAQQCQRVFKPSFPLLVDDIDDSVGNAYSGMPARLYVIDSDGRIAYKAGRGPFGFKPGEMEQALIMTLLDQSTSVGDRMRLQLAGG
jgi:thiol-disulfide isomerase/thioredoxin